MQVIARHAQVAPSLSVTPSYVGMAAGTVFWHVDPGRGYLLPTREFLPGTNGGLLDQWDLPL